MGMSGSAMGLLMATGTANNPEVALMLSPVFLSAIPNAFSGAFRALKDMPPLMQPLAYFVPTTYGLRLLGILESNAAHAQMGSGNEAEMFKEVKEKWWMRHDIITFENDKWVGDASKITKTAELSEPMYHMAFWTLVLVFFMLSGMLYKLKSKTLYM